MWVPINKVYLGPQQEVDVVLLGPYNFTVFVLFHFVTL